MRRLSYLSCFGLLALSTVAAVRSAGQPGNPGVTLKAVKYDALAELVRQNRGKVVLVDFWTTT